MKTHRLILFFAVAGILTASEKYNFNSIGNSEEALTNSTKNEVKPNSLSFKIGTKNGNLYFSPKHFIVRALGIVPQENLWRAKEILENYFGYTCSIAQPTGIKSSYYNSSATGLEADNCIRELQNSNNTIYVVGEELFNRETPLRGYTTMNGNTILVKNGLSFMRETLIHEVGHTLGLGHCNDLTCIMAINNDAEDRGDYCGICAYRLQNN